jgi:ABC-type siderophore export system fused ATPase/permease subunit
MNDNGTSRVNFIVYLCRCSGPLLLLATIAALVSGAAGAGVIVTISKAVQGASKDPRIPWIFFGLCCAWVISKASSEILLLHVTQRVVFRLRVGLGHKILAIAYCPSIGIVCWRL